MDKKDDSNYISTMEYLWKYFELHANQRITLFRFYIAFATIFIYGIGYLAIRFPEKGNDEEWLAVLVSIVFIIVTIIFRKLDLRNRQLIHNAEDALRAMENGFDSEFKVQQKSFNKIKKIKIFKLENDQKISGKALTGHTDCFKWIYRIAYYIAIFILLIAIYRIGAFHLPRILF